MNCIGERERCVPSRDYPKTNNDTQQLKGCFVKCLVGMALAVLACCAIICGPLLDLYGWFLNM